MKTILITGSTDGIGKLAAAKLAGDGHTMILHGRDKAKLANVIEAIKGSSGNNEIYGYTSDLSELKQVAEMGLQIAEDHDHLDVLINNAGVFKSPIEVTADGLDIRFVVNYLSPVLLTESLKPLLQNAKSSRVINLSSAAQSPVSLHALLGEQPLNMQAAYAQSKLALTMWSFHLAKAWPFTTVIAVNPGSLLNTRMVKEAYGRHWSPAEKGGDILYELATSDQFTNSTGQYFDNDQGQFNQAHADAYDAIKVQELITQTNQLIKR